MDCLNVGNLSGAYNSRDIKVAISGIGRPYANRFVGKLQIGSVFVGLGIYRDGFDTKLAAGTNDTQCYFASIRYKNS